MRPLLLGHRGARASRHTPENTLASFELCLQQGCDGFEFDVRRSADGAAVICHDPVFRGLEIENTPATALAPPTLSQVLQHFSARAFLDIELKVIGLETQLIAALREHPPQKGYVVCSFLPDALSAVHDLEASIPLGLLWESRATRTAGRARARVPPSEVAAVWMIPHHELADRTLIDETHAAGKKIMVWTVNRADEMRRMAERGVDAIISDETELLVRSLR